MKKYLLLIILPLIGYAESSLDNISIHPDRTNIQLEIMLKHLQKEILRPEETEELLRNLNRLNSGLLNIPRKNYLLLIDSEVTKSFLDQSQKAPQIEVSKSQLESIRKKLQDFNSKYTDFSKFIIQRIMEDYSAFEQNNLINNYKNRRFQTLSNRAGIRKIKLLNKYESGVIRKFLESNPESFNGFMKTYILKIMGNLANAASVFGHQSFPSQNETFTFIGLEGVKSKSTVDTQQENKNNAREEVEKIQLEERPSMEIDQIIKNIEKE